MADPNPISGMTQEEIDEYKEAFGMFDINGDGEFRLGRLPCESILQKQTIATPGYDGGVLRRRKDTSIA